MQWHKKKISRNKIYGEACPSMPNPMTPNDDDVDDISNGRLA